MDTISMNSENSKTYVPYVTPYESYVLILKLIDKLNLRRGEKSIALSNLSIYYTRKDIKSSYSNSKFKMLAPAWNDKF